VCFCDGQGFDVPRLRGCKYTSDPVSASTHMAATAKDQKLTGNLSCKAKRILKFTYVREENIKAKLREHLVDIK